MYKPLPSVVTRLLYAPPSEVWNRTAETPGGLCMSTPARRQSRNKQEQNKNRNEIKGADLKL